MKPFSAALLLVVFVVHIQAVDWKWLKFPVEAAQGAGDMWRAYTDMIKANTSGADKYFHARGNYDAAERGPGGAWAAEKISDLREGVQKLFGEHDEDSEADQEANNWGRQGNDPNHYRPEKLPDDY